MSNPVTRASERLHALRPALTWAMAAIVLLGVLYFAAARIERMIARWPHGGQAAVSPTHCAEFIAIAKQAYGDTWKARLDPTDTTCAAEVQEAWEQQRFARRAVEEESLSTATAPPPIATPLPAETTAPATQTYCLNVISLAKAKYGDDWATKLDAASRTACTHDLSPKP